MKSTLDITTVEKLLSKYYDGTSTTADQKTLIDFFSKDDQPELPTHMQIDAKIFRQMALLDKAVDNVAIPDDLPYTIEQATFRHERRVWHSIRRYATLTAAASLIGAVTWIATDTIDRAGAERSVSLSPTVTATATSETQTPPPPAEIHHQPLLASTEESPRTTGHDKTQSSPDSTQPASTQESPYHEVTNLDEAMKITRRISHIMSTGGATSTKAGKKVDETITDIVKKIDKVL